jgi:hypothetical protein
MRFFYPCAPPRRLRPPRSLAAVSRVWQLVRCALTGRTLVRKTAETASASPECAEAARRQLAAEAAVRSTWLRLRAASLGAR